MAIYLCHEQPDLTHHEARVIEARPGAVRLSRSAFHPGGGGQVSDIGSLVWNGGHVAVTGVSIEASDVASDVATEVDRASDTWWHLLADPVLIVDGDVELSVDTDHRTRVASLHTMSHVLNALIFDEFAGALVTGAQISGDGVGRMDFDLPEVDNDRLRALEAPLNEIITRGADVRATYVDISSLDVSSLDGSNTAGLIRSKSVAPPPTPDGRLRLIEIEGIDRQACGGTHLTNTAQSRPITITKVENKGRHNRRVRFSFAD